MTGGDRQGPARLGEHLRAARLRSFAGREDELALFRAALESAADSYTVLFLTGPGGIGKSLLLWRFADEATAAGRTVVELDGRADQCDPASFEESVAKVLLDDDRGVLLVDTFERYRALEEWLRNDFLPRLPLGSLVVLAGREPPSREWRTDPGWRDVLRVHVVPELSREDAVTLLRARSVPRSREAAVLAFAGGNPLALCMAAEVARQDTDDADGWAPTQDVIGMLVSQLVGDVPSDAHRQALEVCAQIQLTTEELLRAALPDFDAGALFAWLRDLPFMEISTYGIFPHDVVRDVLEADLRWRDPRRYQTTRYRILSYVSECLRRLRHRSDLASVRAARRLCAAALYLRRDEYGRAWFGTKNPYKAYEDTFRTKDRDAVEALAQEYGDEQFMAIIRYWLDRRPQDFCVYRDAVTRELVGFLAWLRLTERRQADVDADPVTAHAWTRVDGTAPLRAGEHIAIVYPVSLPSAPSSATDLIGAEILARVVRGGSLAWTFVVIDDFEAFHRNPYATQRLDRSDMVRLGGRPYWVLAADRRAAPLEIEGTTTREIRDSDRPSNPAAPAALERPGALSRTDFDAAVRAALRSWRRPDALANNPLTRTVLVRAADSADPVSVLRSRLAEAVDHLREDRRGQQLHGALTVTFFDGAPTQHAAARRLGLPFSTYRRHLTTGLARVCELLWHQQSPATRHVDTGAPPATSGRLAPDEYPLSG